MKPAPTSIIESFDQKLDLYDAFRLSAETAIRELIRLDGINVHSVNSRTKSRESFCEKLARDSKDSYESLEDVTDIVGVRVITHIEDEVDVIGALIRREFQIDEDNSIDKRSALDVDKFGYLSLHYVCSFNTARTTVAENRRFKGLKLEVQVRSILQHAWAEIEHDLGYKAGSTIPSKIRRRFSRLAGLLEIADDEFRRLRDELNDYAKEVPKQIEEAPQNVALDDVSLASYIASSAYPDRIDAEMAAHVNRPLDVSKWDRLASPLDQVGISTIEELANALTQYEKVIVSQWKERVEEASFAKKKNVRRGIAIFHLWQVMAVKSGGPDELIRVFKFAGRSVEDKVLRKSAAVIAAALEADK